MIEFKNFSYTYLDGEGSINNLDLNIQKGEFIVLCGKSGCGKTTLTRIINGLAFNFYKGRFSGEALIEKRDISTIPSSEICLKVGSVFQDPRSQFFDKYTEGEIAFGCENIGLPAEKIRERTDNAAESLSVTKLLGRRLTELSSGEKQKTAIASIYAMEPSVFVLDEPSANLDQKAAEELMAILKGLKKEGKTVIIAEHRVNYLMELADRFLYMNNGKVAEQFSADELTALGEEALASRGLRSVKRMDVDKDSVKKHVDNAYLVIKELSAAYKSPLFSGFSLSAEKGDIVAITGSNGAGKTTLCRILSGLKKEKEGEIRLNGKTLNKRKRLKHMALVLNGADSRTITSKVSDEPLIGLSKKKICEKSKACNDLLKEFQLYNLSDRHPLTLSGGQRQRLSIITALMQDREVIILDEPTSGLDYENMTWVSHAIKASAKQGKVILLVSHDTEFINLAANKIYEV